MFDMTFILQCLHLLEFSVFGSITLLILQWHSKKFTWPKNFHFILVTTAGHLACLYIWPNNLIPLTIIMGFSVYYTGLLGVALPSLISTFSLPFIASNGELLYCQIDTFYYVILILVMSLLGLIRDGFVTAVKKGEPYRLVLSKLGAVRLTIVSSEVDNLRLQLLEQNQRIGQAYANLEDKNMHVHTLKGSLEMQKKPIKT